ncbi:MAG: DUF1570 domain-containing protein [Pirellulales bacterium]|nr:DUF1570 domain-containing protein [Pirellulales bacterium]
MYFRLLSALFAVLAALLPVARLAAVETVTFRDQNREQTVVGRVLIEAQDGGLLFQSRDGAIYNIEPDNLLARESDDAAFEPMSQEEVAQSLLAELPEGFQVHTTANYVICHQASTAYARWCGGLFERLAKAFDNYWSRPPRSIETHEPKFVLVAVVFPNKDSYVQFAQDEVGAAAESMIGYYSQRTNRMVLYDLTGIAAGSSRERLSQREIVRILAADRGGLTIATVIHEATHQIAYNSGVQRRFADNPVWLTEGMAMYFETPDLRSSSGWRTIGAVNKPRLNGFKSQMGSWTTADLQNMISSDAAFRQTATARTAYDVAWALSFYLIKRKSKAYCDFLKAHSLKNRLDWDTPEERLTTFIKHFGELEKLNTDFLRYIQRLR